MKIFFVCDWDYALLWSPVAKKMKDTGVADQCTALVVGRNFYDELLNQQEKVFDHIYLMQDGTEKVPKYIDNIDEKLLRIQEKYSDSLLWRFVWADRSWVKCDYNEIKKRLVVCFEYFEKLYASENPDYILANAYASMPHLIGYEVAKKMNIPIYRPMSVRLEDRYIISNNAMEQEDWINGYFDNKSDTEEKIKKEVEDFLIGFRSRAKKPAFQELRGKEHHIEFGHFYRFFRYIYRYFTSFKGDHTKASPLSRVWSELSWRVKRLYWSRQKLWDDFNVNDKYVYFPLHVQPEMSTMTFAPFYLNQISVLENLSKSLPIDHRIVVKEHPSMLGRRSSEYYKKIKELPNVLFVHPLLDSFKITKNSSAIFTITGTVGLEGLIMKKPVITLGATFYNYCPLVINAKDVPPTGWSKLLIEALNSYQHNEDVLVKFLSAVFSHSFHGLYVEPTADLDKVLDPKNLDVLIKNILIKKDE